MKDASKKRENPSRNRDRIVQNVVYDFFYHDQQRVGSFLSQFHVSEGVPGKFRRTENVSESSAESRQVGILGRKEEDDHRQRDISKEMTFDPIWENARSLIDYLIDHRLVSDEPAKARLGQLMLLRNVSISVIDMGMISSMWGPNHISTLMTMSNSSLGTREEEKLLGSILQSSMPQSLQCYVRTGNNDLWCNLRRGSLVVQTEDFALKHGVRIPGTWNIVSVLDAKPDNRTAAAAKQETEGLSMLCQAVSTLVPFIKESMGRPKSCYGITPILIYRQVN